MPTRLQKSLAISAIGLAALVGNANAGYSDLVIFGDSLSDTGNIFALSGLFAPPAIPDYPGATGRFSDGPVWTDYLADGLGFPNSAIPSNLFLAPVLNTVIPIGPIGGKNYSFGGARTGFGGTVDNTGLLAQLVAWDNSDSLLNTGALSRTADSDGLYVVMAGANDLRDIRSANFAVDQASIDARATQASAVVNNIMGSLALLADAGARHFLISSLPDLGKTPEAVTLGRAAASTDVTLSFNQTLAATADFLDTTYFAGTGVDLDIRTIDFFGLVESIHLDTTNNGSAQFGIINISSPCIIPNGAGDYFVSDATGSGCATAAFSDDLHPSAAVHALLGQAALAAAVPEPSEFALFGAGLLLIAGWRRRAIATARRGQSAR